ncbi:unnamed protein product [Penicillium pancosmium]
MASQKPVIFVVPGAFHRPIHYRKIIGLLRVEGYEVISIDLVVCGDEVDPESSFFDDGAAVRKLLIPFLDKGRKAVIVSHSYGSMPTSVIVEGLTLAERAEQGLQGGIVGVISLAGFAFPVPGKNIMGNEDEIPSPPYQLIKDGVAHLQESAKPLFFSGLDPNEADAEWDALFKKLSVKALKTYPRYVESEFRCSKTYVLCEKDQAVPPAWQEQMALLGGFDIVRVDSGHCPQLSKPRDVLAVIKRVAATAS